MKRHNKIGIIFKDNSGETIVEVIVAFTLLSIMMLVFSQGLAHATTFEVNAKQSRDGADKSMKALQEKLISDNATVDEGESGIRVNNTANELPLGTGSIKPYVYIVNGNTYVVYMPVTSPSGG